jgi:hypothetical protein
LEQGQPEQIVCETPISKVTRAKWTGGVVQVVEHLLCKCEALSSKPSPMKRQLLPLQKANKQTKRTPKVFLVERKGLKMLRVVTRAHVTHRA